jgi:hypothetical protein
MPGICVEDRFKGLSKEDYVCSTWFERDRQHVRLETPEGSTVFELWDEDVSEAIEDGFLTAPRVPRASDTEWQPHAVQYAIDMGLLNVDGSLVSQERNKQVRPAAAA